MTKSAPDVLEAVKTIVTALEKFDAVDRDRIFRWSREMLGQPAEYAPAPMAPASSAELAYAPVAASPKAGSQDIKSFIAEKNPQSDNQFAAAVAYFYEFEAPAGLRKHSVKPADLQEACRLAGRPRLGDPGKTLRNAHGQGYLDSAEERGSFKISTVGENLVAMALPGGGGLDPSKMKKKRRAKAQNKSTKKP